ncbi:hypothetical protein BS78_K096400 [Paspalum vaginatum]|uniref:Uncharacterized protein n=1 Tax=Paspalum vaginatum TaxID=158149 RepID=A0A9W7X7X5_9POAL|nr:hypothetical protein BS78_K200400 [Paspalum vaginatum]KAJ1254532.1 hypothetical protein BS78_K037800 [Paspalum vaginatum]KAJ1257323.1 hypothetical protein BS78_K096400 [Paspalum vaginatum]
MVTTSYGTWPATRASARPASCGMEPDELARGDDLVRPADGPRQALMCGVWSSQGATGICAIPGVRPAELTAERQQAMRAACVARDVATESCVRRTPWFKQHRVSRREPEQDWLGSKLK